MLFTPFFRNTFMTYLICLEENVWIHFTLSLKMMSQSDSGGYFYLSSSSMPLSPRCVRAGFISISAWRLAWTHLRLSDYKVTLIKLTVSCFMLIVRCAPSPGLHRLRPGCPAPLWKWPYYGHEAEWPGARCPSYWRTPRWHAEEPAGA